MREGNLAYKISKGIYFITHISASICSKHMYYMHMKNRGSSMYLRDFKGPSNKLDCLPISFSEEHYVIGHKQIIAANITL